jgi:hypothetical protein
MYAWKDCLIRNARRRFYSTANFPTVSYIQLSHAGWRKRDGHGKLTANSNRSLFANPQFHVGARVEFCGPCVSKQSRMFYEFCFEFNWAPVCFDLPERQMSSSPSMIGQILNVSVFWNFHQIPPIWHLIVPAHLPYLFWWFEFEMVVEMMLFGVVQKRNA